MREKDHRSWHDRENTFYFSLLKYDPAAAVPRNEFQKYSELIGHLLVAEQHNDLLIKNNETRSPDTAPFPEVNAANFHPTWHERNPDLSAVEVEVVVMVVASISIREIILQ